jgi:hypothetical protein
MRDAAPARQYQCTNACNGSDVSLLEGVQAHDRIDAKCANTQRNKSSKMHRRKGAQCIHAQLQQ